PALKPVGRTGPGGTRRAREPSPATPQHKLAAPMAKPSFNSPACRGTGRYAAGRPSRCGRKFWTVVLSYLGQHDRNRGARQDGYAPSASFLSRGDRTAATLRNALRCREKPSGARNCRGALPVEDTRPDRSSQTQEDGQHPEV